MLGWYRFTFDLRSNILVKADIALRLPLTGGMACSIGNQSVGSGDPQQHDLISCSPRGNDTSPQRHLVHRTSVSSISSDTTCVTTESVSTSSTGFHEDIFVHESLSRPMPNDLLALTTYPFVSAHQFCQHSVDSFKACPRCNRVSVRHATYLDSVICVWCYMENGVEANSWFCFRCLKPTSSLGRDDHHYSYWLCREG